MNVLSLLSGSENGSNSAWLMYVMIGVIAVLFVVMLIVQRRGAKKRQDEQDALMNAVRPGNKVKTIGGICGIVVEINEEDNTFVLETGSETTGKYYIKFDKQAILQTDAKVESAKDDKKTEEVKDAETEKEDAELAAETETELPEKE